jgi:hypothetical protein
MGEEVGGLKKCRSCVWLYAYYIEAIYSAFRVRSHATGPGRIDVFFVTIYLFWRD